MSTILQFKYYGAPGIVKEIQKTCDKISQIVPSFIYVDETPTI